MLGTNDILGSFNHWLQGLPVLGRAHPMPVCSVVALKISLGLENGLETTFLKSWSCLCVDSIFTRSCLSLGLAGLGIFPQDKLRPQLQ